MNKFRGCFIDWALGSLTFSHGWGKIRVLLAVMHSLLMKTSEFVPHISYWQLAAAWFFAQYFDATICYSPDDHLCNVLGGGHKKDELPGNRSSDVRSEDIADTITRKAPTFSCSIWSFCLFEVFIFHLFFPEVLCIFYFWFPYQDHSSHFKSMH